MNIYTIYKSTCITTGKSYIGFDSNWPRRLSEHKSACKKQKISNSHQGVKRSWTKDFNQSEFMREVSKRKKPGTSKSLIGNNNHKHDIIVRCPSCDKSGSYPIMKRWHFDRCKLVPISSV